MDSWFKFDPEQFQKELEEKERTSPKVSTFGCGEKSPARFEFSGFLQKAERKLEF